MSDLLPPNATAQERALSLAIGRDVPTPVSEVWDADTCPAPVLAWLAWAFSVDEWDTGWTDEQKRAYIKRSMQQQKYKGTIGAVQEALSSLFYQSRVQEWFNKTPAGDPYTFNVLVNVDQVGIPQESVLGVLSVIDRTKNLRSHLGAIELKATTIAGPVHAAVASVGSNISVTFGG